MNSSVQMFRHTSCQDLKRPSPHLSVKSAPPPQPSAGVITPITVSFCKTCPPLPPQVWRRRRYRVRRGSTPGTFYFSVLDNGVTSNEYWRILDCDEALSWCLFYYSGAASTAGLSYSGAVLAT